MKEAREKQKEEEQKTKCRLGQKGIKIEIHYSSLLRERGEKRTDKGENSVENICKLFIAFL